MKELFFTFEPGYDAHRQAYRAKVPGLSAKDKASGASYPVQDISAGGVSLADPEGALGSGCALEIDILIREHVIITGLKAEVARRHKDVAGLKFTDLTRRQEERLDKLVLEVQKHLISMKKSGGSHIDDEQET